MDLREEEDLANTAFQSNIKLRSEILDLKTNGTGSVPYRDHELVRRELAQKGAANISLHRMQLAA